MTGLELVPTPELVDELVRRSKGCVIAISHPSSQGEYITAFDSNHLVTSMGLLSIVKVRMETWTEETFYPDIEDGEDD